MRNDELEPAAILKEMVKTVTVHSNARGKGKLKVSTNPDAAPRSQLEPAQREPTTRPPTPQAAKQPLSAQGAPPRATTTAPLTTAQLQLALLDALPALFAMRDEKLAEEARANRYRKSQALGAPPRATAPSGQSSDEEELMSLYNEEENVKHYHGYDDLGHGSTFSKHFDERG